VSTATQAKPAHAPPRMSLANVYVGRRAKPDRILLVGTEGVGKSTFAANAPEPIFLAAEDGIGHLDVASFPEPKSLDDVFQVLRVLREEPHDYKAAVIDTVDWLEPLVFDEVCTRNNWENIEAPGYGKGYTVALDEWRKILADLDRLRAEREMEIILIAHTAIKVFSNPSGPDFSRYELNLNRQASALLKQWADAVLFANYEEFVQKEKGEVKAKGVSTGRRVIHTTRRAAWDAKNRHYLPEVLPLDYGDYAAARAKEQPGSPEMLAGELDALLAELKPDKATRAKVLSFVGDRTDARKLAQACDRIRTLIEENGK